MRSTETELEFPVGTQALTHYPTSSQYTRAEIKLEKIEMTGVPVDPGHLHLILALLSFHDRMGAHGCLTTHRVQPPRLWNCSLSGISIKYLA
jgi:hypothetical protein